jgi:hypothetical protein
MVNSRCQGIHLRKLDIFLEFGEAGAEATEAVDVLLVFQRYPRLVSLPAEWNQSPTFLLLAHKHPTFLSPAVTDHNKNGCCQWSKTCLGWIKQSHVCFKLQDECNRRMQIEATLLMTEGLHSQLQEEMKTLTQDFDRSTKKLSELENNKIDLESTLKELKLINIENSTLHENQQSLARISDHESELMTVKIEQENVERKVHMIE